MKKYRKKPVEVEAIQFREDTYKEVRAFCPTVVFIDSMNLYIPTLEGDMKAAEGDWIIKGIAGEFYPCKPDIFEKTYEESKPLK